MKAKAHFDGQVGLGVEILRTVRRFVAASGGRWANYCVACGRAMAELPPGVL